MLDADENKSLEKSGQRNPPNEQRGAKARQKKGKSAQPRSPKPDELQDSREQLVTSAEASNEAAQASDAPNDIQPHDTQPDSSVAAAEAVPPSLQSLSRAYEDYTRKSFEQAQLFFEKLAGARSLDKVFELQTDFVKEAYETFVADSQKIGTLHWDLARQRRTYFVGWAAKMFPQAHRAS